MKINVAYPAGGGQKLIQFDNDQQLRVFFEKRIGAEVPVDSLGPEWKGYVMRITGGADKEGFPMKQGVLTPGRVRLLLNERSGCFHALRKGERRRKSVRGCIVDQNLSVINLIITKKGDSEIPGLTDKTIPRRLGPKRATKIRKLFNLEKQDDVRKYVVRRPLEARKKKDGVKEYKPRSKAPKIQRLITPITLQRTRHRIALKRRRAAKAKEEKADYLKLLAERTHEARERKLERKRSRSSRLSASRASTSESAAAPAKAEAAAPKPAKVAKSSKLPPAPILPTAPAKATAAAEPKRKEPKGKAEAPAAKPAPAKADAPKPAAKEGAKTAKPKQQPAAKK